MCIFKPLCCYLSCNDLLTLIQRFSVAQRRKSFKSVYVGPGVMAFWIPYGCWFCMCHKAVKVVTHQGNTGNLTGKESSPQITWGHGDDRQGFLVFYPEDLKVTYLFWYQNCFLIFCVCAFLFFCLWWGCRLRICPIACLCNSMSLK